MGIKPDVYTSALVDLVAFIYITQYGYAVLTAYPYEYIMVNKANI